MINVLSCSFPTTIVLVDDKMSLLDALVDALNLYNKVTFKKFTNPLDALNFVNQVSTVNRLDCSDLIRSGDEESTSDWKSTMLNINKLHQKIYSTDRFYQISTVVVDYQMNEMNGVQFCAAINDKNIQKNLLTGIADEKVAINAFNDGDINRFIKKDIEDLETKLVDSINKSIYSYFSAYTENLSNHLSIHDKTRFKDPVFANFFFNICLSKSYTEYYMLDNLGSYLFMNPRGQCDLLSVTTESESERIIDIGVQSGEIEPHVLEILRSREYMLVSHSRTGSLPPISEWNKYILPARKLDGYQTYYFSITDSTHLDLDFEKIKSFEFFKKTEDLL